MSQPQNNHHPMFSDVNCGYYGDSAARDREEMETSHMFVQHIRNCLTKKGVCTCMWFYPFTKEYHIHYNSISQHTYNLMAVDLISNGYVIKMVVDKTLQSKNTSSYQLVIGRSQAVDLEAPRLLDIPLIPRCSMLPCPCRLPHNTCPHSKVLHVPLPISNIQDCLVTPQHNMFSHPKALHGEPYGLLLGWTFLN